MKNIRLDSFMIPFKDLLPEQEPSSIFLIVLYDKPRDFPGGFVGRLFVLNKPTAYIVIRETFEELLETIPGYMVRLDPEPLDDPNIKAIFV